MLLLSPLELISISSNEFLLLSTIHNLDFSCRITKELKLPLTSKARITKYKMVKRRVEIEFLLNLVTYYVSYVLKYNLTCFQIKCTIITVAR